MTDHDPLCPQHLQYPGHRSRCICVLLREADSRARADEHAARCDHLLEAAALAAQAIHAEAVAARLVEVICEQDAERHWFCAEAITALRTERDAARAEVAALREQQAAWAESCARYVSEVLADLRAKAQGLPCRTWVPPHATDCPGRPGKRGICTCGDSLRASDWMLRADVLALIEEVDRG